MMYMKKMPAMYGKPKMDGDPVKEGTKKRLKANVKKLNTMMQAGGEKGARALNELAPVINRQIDSLGVTAKGPKPKMYGKPKMKGDPVKPSVHRDAYGKLHKESAGEKVARLRKEYDKKFGKGAAAKRRAKNKLKK